MCGDDTIQKVTLFSSVSSVSLVGADYIKVESLNYTLAQIMSAVPLLMVYKYQRILNALKQRERERERELSI